jgi:hypothetical protein
MAKVKITLPKARGSEPKELLVGINGVNYLIPKGKQVEVPDFVAEEVKRAQAAEDFMDEQKDEMLKSAQVAKK